MPLIIAPQRQRQEDLFKAVMATQGDLVSKKQTNKNLKPAPVLLILCSKRISKTYRPRNLNKGQAMAPVLKLDTLPVLFCAQA